MNTIISLCHFCEIHGPAVLFCTQEILKPKNSASCSSANCTDDYGFLQSYLTTSQSVDGDENKVGSEISTSKKCRRSSESCDACQSFKTAAPGFMSSDEASSKVFISTQHPYENMAFKIVRQTCVQSISCEQCPGQVGPMFFGEDGGPNTFSYKFFLKDFHSRGFKRSYSINIISRDRIFLLDSWEFFVRNLEEVVLGLKTDADEVFNVEHSQHGSGTACKSPTISSSSSLSAIHQKSFRQQKGHGKQARSLCDVTGNPDLFAHLHRSFVRLMKTSSERLKESVPTGNNQHLVDLNKQEETEEGFVKVFSLPVKECDEKEVRASSEDKSVAVFTHLRSLLKVLGQSTFAEVIYHVLIGTQILVRAQDKEVTRSIIDCFKVLVPDGCQNIRYHTNNYNESMHCNFIGMPLLPLLPPDLRPCLLLDVSGVHTLKKTPPVDRGRIYECLRGEIEELLLRYYMVTFEKVHLPVKNPTILENVEKIILNECLDNSIVDLCLASLKEDWFNKAKAYFMYTKTGQRSKNDLDRFLQVLGARVEDKIVLTFWMTAIFPKDIQAENR